MNVMHMKYAVEIANTKSISKAAENLYMGQPNLSRAIKELEESLGITIFKRTTKGISVTPEGEEFLQYAKRIISQVEEVEEIYRNGKSKKQRFSVCVPRASYISDAFAEFAKNIDTSVSAEIFYKETNSMRTINNIVKEDYNLGIIRYQSSFDKYFTSMFNEKKLMHETITEFSYVLLMSKSHPLADKEKIELKDLADYIEISHADPYVPSLPLIDVKKAELSESVDKHIFVFERGSQFVLLEKVPTTFMWVSPIPDDLLEKYSLVQKKCIGNTKLYKDVLIYRKGYKLTELDDAFITEVCTAKRKIM
ncbi:MAG: LysR family transcriptional regulator [Oscillospiraceae bacterium]|nr:LysR family transcriptional regulator [Oscillospiraceae bacterium]